MKKILIILACLIVLFALIYACTSRKRSLVLNLQDYSELTLTERPAWSQWRAEGNGIKKFFRHFLDYQEKAEKIALNPFPGQRAFFETQKELLANLPQPAESLDYVRIGFVGDLMEVPLDKGPFISPDILNTLHHMDFVLGNLETPVSQSSAISRFRNALSQFNVSPDYLNFLSIKEKPVFTFYLWQIITF